MLGFGALINHGLYKINGIKPNLDDYRYKWKITIASGHQDLYGKLEKGKIAGQQTILYNRVKEYKFSITHTTQNIPNYHEY